MTDRASLADAIDPRITHARLFVDGALPAGFIDASAKYLIAASDALRTPTPDHAALVQALLATCDHLGMTNRPADAPAAFARVLGEFGGSEPPGDACRNDVELLAIRLADMFGDPALFNQDRNMLPGHGPGECESCDGKRERYRVNAREILSRHSQPGDACRAAAEEIVSETGLHIQGGTALVAAIISRHLPPDRYGEALGWRPIAGAPEDTMVLICVPSDATGHPVRMIALRDSRGAWVDTYMNNLRQKPTRWMPLPGVPDHE